MVPRHDSSATWSPSADSASSDRVPRASNRKTLLRQNIFVEQKISDFPSVARLSWTPDGRFLARFNASFFAPARAVAAADPVNRARPRSVRRRTPARGRETSPPRYAPHLRPRRQGIRSTRSRRERRFEESHRLPYRPAPESQSPRQGSRDIRGRRTIA